MLLLLYLEGRQTRTDASKRNRQVSRPPCPRSSAPEATRRVPGTSWGRCRGLSPPEVGHRRRLPGERGAAAPRSPRPPDHLPNTWRRRPRGVREPQHFRPERPLFSRPAAAAAVQIPPHPSSGPRGTESLLLGRRGARSLSLTHSVPSGSSDRSGFLLQALAAGCVLTVANASVGFLNVTNLNLRAHTK